MTTDLTAKGGHYWVPPDDVIRAWSLILARIEEAKGKGPAARLAQHFLAQERGEGGRPL